MIKRIILFMIGFCVHLGAFAICDSAVLGFFNGVNTTRDDSARALILIKNLSGSTTPQKFSEQLFYNQTHGLWQDVLEFLEQKANAINASLSLKSDLLFTTDERFAAFLEKIDDPTLKDQLKALRAEDAALKARAAAYALDPATAQEDYAQHNQQVKDAAANGSKLVLVAHSQGNLFLNQAYDSARLSIGASSIQTIHVAPPTNVVHGPYVLAYIDLVILPLSPRLNANAPMLPSLSDPLGHGFIETYLDPDRGASEKIASHLSNAFLNSDFEGLPVCKPVSDVCPTTFPRGILDEIKPGLTVSDVNKVFGCTHQRHSSSSNWYVWANPATLINTSMDVATVKFINGIFKGTSPGDKYFVGSSVN